MADDLGLWQAEGRKDPGSTTDLGLVFSGDSLGGEDVDLGDF